eukprot:404120-Rhodomonas_salina.1
MSEAGTLNSALRSSARYVSAGPFVAAYVDSTGRSVRGRYRTRVARPPDIVKHVRRQYRT